MLHCVRIQSGIFTTKSLLHLHSVILRFDGKELSCGLVSLEGHTSLFSVVKQLFATQETFYSGFTKVQICRVLTKLIRNILTMPYLVEALLYRYPGGSRKVPLYGKVTTSFG